MHIRRIQLQNVRCFEKLEVAFHRTDGHSAGWFVLAGRNGSGKSTLLRAIALAFGGPENASLLLDSALKNWIRHERLKCAVATDCDRNQLHDRIDSAFSSDDLRFELNWFRQNVSENPRYVMAPLREKNHEKKFFPWDFLGEGWFLAAYGPYRQLGGNRQTRLNQAPMVARLLHLFRDDAPLDDAVEWLQTINHKKLQADADGVTPNPFAELEQAVIALLDDGLLPDGVQIEAVRADGLWAVQNGIRLQLQELSDGYKSVAALVLDLLGHLHRCFGVLKLEPASENDFGWKWAVPWEGVVLIDEPEVHLHVSWQQKIGFWLKHHFPNIQFIVATHSPFVCQAADPGALIRLPAPNTAEVAAAVPEAVYYDVVNGSADEAVLSELFGLDTAHSRRSEKLRDRVSELEIKIIRHQASEDEKREYAAIKTQLPNTLGMDAERILRRFGKEA